MCGGVVEGSNLAEVGEGVSEASSWGGSGRNTIPKRYGRLCRRNEKTEGGGQRRQCRSFVLAKRREAISRSGWRFLKRRGGAFHFAKRSRCFSSCYSCLPCGFGCIAAAREKPIASRKSGFAPIARPWGCCSVFSPT